MFDYRKDLEERDDYMLARRLIEAISKPKGVMMTYDASLFLTVHIERRLSQQVITFEEPTGQQPSPSSKTGRRVFSKKHLSLLIPAASGVCSISSRSQHL
eukprot:758865-Hanusia_phi.AAC.5